MKKLLAVVIAVASATAFATEFKWTGGGAAGSWKDEANWGGDGYPHEAGDKAAFVLTADLAVTLDTGCETPLVGVTVSGAGKLTLTASEGSSFVNATGTSSFMVEADATLDLGVDFTSSVRTDLQGPGTYYIRANVRNTANVALYPMYGTFYIVDHGSMGSKGIIGAGYCSGHQDDPLYIELRDYARLWSEKRIEMGSHAQSPSVTIVQNGADTVCDNTGYLSLGEKSNPTYERRMEYRLKSGTLNITGDFRASNERPGWYVQEGGTANVGGSLYLGSTTGSATSKYNGGSFRLEGGTFSLGSRIVANAPNMELQLAGGVFEFADRSGSGYLDVNNGGTGERFRFSGTPTIRLGIGKRLRFYASPIFERNAVLTLEGADENKFGLYTDLLVSSGSGLTLRNSVVKLPTGRFVRMQDGATDPWTLMLTENSRFVYENTGSYVTAPMKVITDATSAIDHAGSRHYAPCRAITIDGAAVTSADITWVLAASTYGFVSSADKNSAYTIEKVWTGAGDGRSWSDKNNWAEGAVPNNATWTVDLTAAKGDIVIDQNVSVRAIVLGSGGTAKKVSLVDSDGTHTMTIGQRSYLASFLVDKERTLVMDVRTPFNNVGSAVTGRGNLIFKRSIYCGTSDPSNNSPVLCIEANVIYEGATEAIPFRYGYADYQQVLGYWSFCAGEACEVVFGEGTDLAITNLVTGRSGYTPFGIIRQRGATMWFDEMYINHHHSTAVTPFEYKLESGILNVGTGLYLNRHFPDCDKTWTRYKDGDFRMTGGTLTTPLMSSECFNNYFYLYGGDIYLGAGGIEKTDDATLRGTYVANTTPGVKLGGVKLHATADFTVNVDTVFDGTGGATTIDTGANAVAFAVPVTGSAPFVKTGAGTLSFNAVCGFTGDITVRDGTLALGAEATVSASPRRIVLASEESLTLAGQTLEVSDLIVGGVRQAAGDYTFGTGTVSVSGAATDSIWTGASGANWTSTGNWSGTVPNGESAVADFSAASTLPAAVTLDADVTLGKLVFARPGASEGALTIAAAGARTLTLAAGAKIAVPRGLTLTIDADVILGGAITVEDGGAVVFGGAVSAATETVLTVLDGAEVAFEGVIEGVTPQTFTASDDPATSTVVFKGEDCSITLADHFPSYCEGSTAGKAVIDGATVTFTNAPHFADANGPFETVTLKAGALNLTSGIVNDGGTSAKKKGILELDGGTVNCTVIGTVLPNGLDVVLGGAVAFAQAGHAEALDSQMKTAITANLGGAGSIEQKGPGILCLVADASNVEGFKVSGGLIDLSAATGATNLTATVGTLRIGPAAAESIDPATVVSADAGTLLDLDYDGTAQIREIWLGGRQRVKGLYSSETAPRLKWTSYFTGIGSLLVAEGDLPGALLLVR